MRSLNLLGCVVVAVLAGLSCSTRADEAAATADRVVTANKPIVPREAKTWNQFLGPQRNNHSLDRRLLTKWPKQGPPLLWTATGAGSAYSSVAVAEGLVLTMGNLDERECVIAYDLESGQSRWVTPTGEAYHDGTGDGPRGTPTIDGDLVFALGGHGVLTCLELSSGEIRWSKNLLEEFEGHNITWGISESVLVDGHQVICTPGGNKATMAALARETGDVIWTAIVPGAGPAGYASPVPTTVDGVRQYVTFTHQGVISVRASDGEFLWIDGDSANGTANCSTPLVFEEYVFSSSGYGRGGALLKLSSSDGKTTAERQYHTMDLKSHHGGMVLVGDHIYGADDAELVCIAAKTGKVAWKNRSVGKGSVTFADGHVILRSEGGPIALVEATPAKYVEKGRFDQPERSDRPSWSYPVVAEGRLFLRDQDKVFCYDLRP
jgi:outer membrane protein assembly factor BamB